MKADQGDVLSTIQYVNIEGKRLSIHELRTKHKPPPRAPASPLKRTFDRQSAKASDGFVVTGFSPEHLAKAQIEHEIKIDLIKARNEAQRHEQSPIFERVPDLWNEDRYMLNAKPQRVRQKPYELAEAADLCARLAIKSGWLCVTVEELMKA